MILLVSGFFFPFLGVVSVSSWWKTTTPRKKTREVVFMKLLLIREKNNREGSNFYNLRSPSTMSFLCSSISARAEKKSQHLRTTLRPMDGWRGMKEENRRRSPLQPFDFFLILSVFFQIIIMTERILKVRKKSGNRERCRKLSLWNRSVDDISLTIPRYFVVTKR